MYHRGFGRLRNTVVLPPGWYLTALSAPSTIRTLPDERKMMDYRVISNRVYEYAYQIVIRNHKKEAVNITVNEPIGGDWEMLSSSHKWEKTAAFASRFAVPVAADGSATLA